MQVDCNISVVVVSHNRAEHLHKMLACLDQQDICGFETIVVTNTMLNTALNIDLPKSLTMIAFEQANIAKARNIGIAAAKGDFIAFCDDDALPDPGWLRGLMAGFANVKIDNVEISGAEIGGASGFTRGRNGISKQWGAILTDRLAQDKLLDIFEKTVFAPNQNQAPVMIGTNCAFRKSALMQVGGFDENYAYYLDDSDISLRLSQAGWKLAVLPDCQVHHNFASSAMRKGNRAFKSLQQLGKSKAYFCRKFGDSQNINQALSDFRKLQLQRLDDQFLLGKIAPDEMNTIRQSLETGFSQGAKLQVEKPQNKPMPKDKKQPVFSVADKPHIVLAGRPKNRETLAQKAKELTKNGFRVSVICLGYSAMYMQIGFSKHGYWLHNGGRFGKIERHENLWRWSTFKGKVLNEVRRMSINRPVNLLTFLEPDASLSPQKFGISSLNGYKVLDDSKLWSESGKQ